MHSRMMMLLLIWLLVLSFRPAATSEEDTLEECWLDDPLGSKGPWADQCCRPKPCGLDVCWAPPTFTYEFCCGEDSCRPLIIEEVKSGLDLAVKSLPNSNASVLAFRAAPEAFRKLLKLEGVQLSGENQKCNCAVAYAAAALVRLAEENPKLALAVQPWWLVYGVDWKNLLKDGWGGIFGWLNRFALELEGPQVDDSVDMLEEADLDQRQREMMDVISAEQAEARKIMDSLQRVGQVTLLSLLHALRTHGTFGRIWKKLNSDLAWRKHGQKCVVTRGTDDQGRWICEPWTYHIDANFSSLLPKYKQAAGLNGVGESRVAVCVLGAPRTVVKTYPSTRENVVRALSADTFVYVPFQSLLTPALEEDLKGLGEAVTAILVPDVDRDTFEARVISELKDPKFRLFYGMAKGPWRAPLFRQMGSSMWGYHNQHGCRRMVESFENQRGWQYEWVVFARAEMFWTQRHPPVEVLDPAYVHIPMGQDNNNYNFNPLKGVNDRHAVVPKRWFDAYFNRYQSILDGSAWSYLARVAQEGYMINTEQYLLLHLEAHKVQIRRFPPVSFLSHCTEGPQCQHLYKGTNLGKQRWTPTAKYFTEMLEARRTTVDDFHKVRRLESGWIWMPVWPHVAWIWGIVKKDDRNASLQDMDPKELLGSDVVCGLSKHGAISSLRWIFFKRCECHAS
ncbi:unnamed protein product [Durusdinium trenchii]|uniref:Uncharacterized protein n=3 Tax=Durusdinium trenchii TaxID=1381693 RepID=A0ABP0LGJ9_9DINO